MTQISSQDSAPGDSITDTVAVSGIGALELPVTVQLYGPYPSIAAIDCAGTPAWTGTFVAKGDGEYVTDEVPVGVAGYYVYHESIAAGQANTAAQTTCADTAETTFVHATPAVETLVSNAVVRPGSTITDRIKVTGLGTTPARVGVELFGPFASRGAIGCGGTPVYSGTLDVKGDGIVSSAPVRLRSVGFYAFRERIAGSPLVDAVDDRVLGRGRDLARGAADHHRAGRYRVRDAGRSRRGRGAEARAHRDRSGSTRP